MTDPVDRAYLEWEADGVVSTSTFNQLTNLGFDAQAIIDSFEENANGN